MVKFCNFLDQKYENSHSSVRWTYISWTALISGNIAKGHWEGPWKIKDLAYSSTCRSANWFSCISSVSKTNLCNSLLMKVASSWAMKVRMSQLAGPDGSCTVWRPDVMYDISDAAWLWSRCHEAYSFLESSSPGLGGIHWSDIWQEPMRR